MNSLEIIVENFAAIKDDPVKLLDRIPHSDGWFDCIWTFESHVQDESLSIKAECDPCLGSDSPWYAFVQMELSLRHDNSDPPLQMRKSMLLNDKEPNLIFTGIADLDVLLDPSKGFISESGEINIRIEILRCKLYKCVTANELPANFWTVRNHAKLPEFTNRHYGLYLFNCLEFNDCAIKASDGSVAAHKLLLAAQNDFFKDQLYTQGKELINFDHLPKRIILMLLAFIYKHEFIVDDESIVDLHELALEVGISELAQLCRLHLMPSGVCRILGCESNKYSEQLKSHCREYVLKNRDLLKEKDLIRKLERTELELLVEKLSQKSPEKKKN